MQLERADLYLAGRWRPPAQAKSIALTNPATQEYLGSVPEAGPTDIDVALAGARSALTDSRWADLIPATRADLLDRFADELERRAEATARIVTAENGMPSSLALPAEGMFPAEVIRYYAQLCRETPLEEWRAAIHGRGTTLVRREPVGVVAAITPWNYPQSLAVFKIAPALAAGCVVILKPAPETALDAFQLADAAEAAGLPDGVLSIVPGYGDLGEYLVTHPGVDKVAFTGSTTAGRHIAEACGRLLRPVTLELGGKSAAIVLEDADSERLARGLAWAGLQNQGQTCHLSTRIVVPRSRYAEIVDSIAAMASSLSVGDPTDPNTRIGPLVSERQRTSVEGYLAQAREDGTIVTGGRRPPGLARGWYVEPTIISDIDPRSSVVTEEIFGPVLAVLPYDTVDEAVAIANDSRYGLAGTVWTADIERGVDFARRIKTGTVGINSFDIDIGAPFGGVKDSGMGRELGPEGLAAYFDLKSIYTRMKQEQGASNA
ncbi:aldehyde dehydrogenase [Microbacterium sp. A93]|uniref:aldehyde dehydrogenase n=1 Tax=Microbacterium sp. A93 TaxID=3450716 RepID=UPI003F42EDC2